jgi:hypothetical protein
MLKATVAPVSARPAPTGAPRGQGAVAPPRVDGDPDLLMSFGEVCYNRSVFLAGTTMVDRASPKASQRTAPRSGRDTNGRFLTGNSGGPGRPPGSRNRLGEDFISALHADWIQHGPAVLERVRRASPAAYLRVIASVIPQHVAIEPRNDFSHLTDDELDAALREEIAAASRMLARKKPAAS